MAPGKHAMARKYFKSSNTITSDEAGQLQMDQSAAMYCLKFDFYFQCISDIFPYTTFLSFGIVFRGV